MTIRDKVIETLRQADGPLMQADIAYRAGALQPSVRRTCQELLRDGAVRVVDYGGWQGTPRLTLATSNETATPSLT